MIALFNPATGSLAALADLHAACFPDAWTAKAIGDLLATPNCFAFSSRDGFIMARAAAGEAEILTIAVAPPARRQGLGHALAAAAATHVHALGAVMLFLEVDAANAAAIALYRGLGFERVAERKGYYQGRDALVMKTPLPLSLPAKFA